jgi:hypothetical protein
MGIALLAASLCPIAAAQQPAAKQPAAKSPDARPVQPAAKPAATVDDAARKAEILASPRFRRAIFELGEWLASQKIYDAQQVAKIKDDFNTRVHYMTADEVRFLLDDLEAKFQIMNTQEAQDARAWMARYLSILSDKKREEVIRKLPNFATMTPAQLQQEVARIEQRREAMQEQQATVNRLGDSAANPWTQGQQAAQAAYIRDHTMQRSAYSSPYRAGNNEPPFSNVHVGADLGYYVTPYGGLGMVFGNGF